MSTKVKEKEKIQKHLASTTYSPSYTLIVIVFFSNLFLLLKYYIYKLIL